MAITPTWLYVLRLQGDRWYVGTTRGAVEERLQQHRGGVLHGGTPWTELYPPLPGQDAVYLFREYADRLEARLAELLQTVQLAWEFGVDSVRGAQLTQLDPDRATLLGFAHAVAHLLDLDFEEVEEEFGLVDGDSENEGDDDDDDEDEDGDDDDDEDGDDVCNRCGRPGHRRAECYARYDADGRRLN